MTSFQAVSYTVVCVWAILVTCSSAEISEYPVGDFRSCMHGTYGPRYRFEVLPGGGWDNLRNKETGMIVKLNFSQCRTTEDGRFLLPDSVFTVPLKTSYIETNSEIFLNWKEFKSTLSHSININAGMTSIFYDISGSFSAENQQVKSSQQYEKSFTTRTQARYLQYSSKLEPDSPVSDAFRKRLHKIAASILLNRTDLAFYDSQLLVRDYGTHVITSLDVGAALVQVDQVQEDYLKKFQGNNNSLGLSVITSAASADFTNTFKLDSKTSRLSSQEQVDAYQKSRTSSKIVSYGGPVLRPTNFSANQWLDLVENELVALDKAGSPIYYLVNHVNMPYVPPSIVYQVSRMVERVVEMYYRYNTIPGCTKKESPNFSFQANADDGSCHKAKSNFTFGGVYQTCTNDGEKDYCAALRQVNPKTGNYSCPSGYEAVLLQTGSAETTENRDGCASCFFIFTCCTPRSYQIRAEYRSYWCAAIRNMALNTGFLFGGLYTTTTININTQSQSCPNTFYPMKLLTDLMICISDDYEFGTQNSLPFAGFFSCKSGNPLVFQERPMQNGLDSMWNKFMLDSGPSYSTSCPESYSQHLATIDEGCSIHYCIKTGAISALGLLPIRLPPFMEAPQEGFSVDQNISVVVNDNGEGWMSNDEAMAMNDPVEIVSEGNQTERQLASANIRLSVGYPALMSIVLTFLIE